MRSPNQWRRQPHVRAAPVELGPVALETQGVRAGRPNDAAKAEPRLPVAAGLAHGLRPAPFQLTAWERNPFFINSLPHSRRLASHGGSSLFHGSRVQVQEPLYFGRVTGEVTADFRLPIADFRLDAPQPIVLGCSNSPGRNLESTICDKDTEIHNSQSEIHNQIMGLFGYIDSTGRTAALPIVQQMGAGLRHLDSMIVETVAPSSSAAFGRVANGIGNCAPQPVRATGDGVWLWLTGEFFHDDELRGDLVRAGLLKPEADEAALALAVYRRGGAEAIASLSGEYFVAIWDGRTSEAILINDRFGLHPQYIAHVAGAFVFAPELKAIVAAPRIPRRIDRVALAEYLRFQLLLGDRTWLEDARLIPPASILRYSTREDRVTLQTYWDWDRLRELRVSFNEAVEETIRLFQRSIDARIRTQRIGVYLSGGLDSRMILAFIGGRVPVTTITYGQAGCRDVVYAERVARCAGTHHQWFPFADGRWVQEYAPLHFALTEGMHGWEHAHGISTLDEASRSMDVNLTGWRYGGTMPTSTLFDLIDPPGQSDSAALRAMFDLFTQSLAWPGLIESEAEALLTDTKGDDLRGVAFDSLRNRYSRTTHYPPDRRIRCFVVSQDERRAIMNLVVFTRARLNVRCPWLDYDFMDFVWSLPRPIFTGLELRRAVLTRRQPALARIPYAKDQRLPHERTALRSAHATLHRIGCWTNRHLLRFRPERPTLYADYEHWLRTDLRAWAEDLLLSPRTLDRRLFSADAVRALWDRHLSGRELWTIGKLAPMMTIERVLRTLFDEPTDRHHEAGPGVASAPLDTKSAVLRNRTVDSFV